MNQPNEWVYQAKVPFELPGDVAKIIAEELVSTAESTIEPINTGLDNAIRNNDSLWSDLLFESVIIHYNTLDRYLCEKYGQEIRDSWAKRIVYHTINAVLMALYPTKTDLDRMNYYDIFLNHLFERNAYYFTFRSSLPNEGESFYDTTFGEFSKIFAELLGPEFQLKNLSGINAAIFASKFAAIFLRTIGGYLEKYFSEASLPNSKQIKTYSKPNEVTRNYNDGFGWVILAYFTSWAYCITPLICIWMNIRNIIHSAQNGNRYIWKGILGLCLGIITLMLGVYQYMTGQGL